MNDELKQLIEDAAKLLGHRIYFTGPYPPYIDGQFGLEKFNPLDPERGDLMMVAMAMNKDFAVLSDGVVVISDHSFTFTKGDHESLSLAILRAASAVLHSRGGV